MRLGASRAGCQLPIGFLVPSPHQSNQQCQPILPQCQRPRRRYVAVASTESATYSAWQHGWRWLSRCAFRPLEGGVKHNSSPLLFLNTRPARHRHCRMTFYSFCSLRASVFVGCADHSDGFGSRHHVEDINSCRLEIVTPHIWRRAERAL